MAPALVFVALSLLGVTAAQPCTDADTSWLKVDRNGAPYVRLPSKTNFVTGYEHEDSGTRDHVLTTTIGYVGIRSGLEINSPFVIVNSSDTYHELHSSPGPTCGLAPGPPAPTGFTKTALGGLGSATNCANHPNPHHGNTCLWDDNYCVNAAGGQCGILETEVAEKCGQWPQCAGVMCSTDTQYMYCFARGQIDLDDSQQFCNRYAYIKTVPAPVPPPGTVFVPRSYPRWGESDSCTGSGSPVQVDLSNTPFKLHNGPGAFQPYEMAVSGNHIASQCNADNNTCTGSCGGYCGGCRAGPNNTVKLDVVDSHSFECGVAAYNNKRTSLESYKCEVTMGGAAQQCVPTLGGFSMEDCSRDCKIYQCLEGQCVESRTNVGLVWSECERGCAVARQTNTTQDTGDDGSHWHDAELIAITAATCLVVASLVGLLVHRIRRKERVSERKALLETILGAESKEGRDLSAEAQQSLVDELEEQQNPTSTPSAWRRAMETCWKGRFVEMETRTQPGVPTNEVEEPNPFAQQHPKV